jgi:hypothetical protein
MKTGRLTSRQACDLPLWFVVRGRAASIRGRHLGLLSFARCGRAIWPMRTGRPAPRLRFPVSLARAPCWRSRRSRCFRQSRERRPQAPCAGVLLPRLRDEKESKQRQDRRHDHARPRSSPHVPRFEKQRVLDLPGCRFDIVSAVCDQDDRGPPPDCLTIRAQRWTSSRTKAANSAALLPTGMALVLQLLAHTGIGHRRDDRRVELVREMCTIKKRGVRMGDYEMGSHRRDISRSRHIPATDRDEGLSLRRFVLVSGACLVVADAWCIYEENTWNLGGSQSKTNCWKELWIRSKRLRVLFNVRKYRLEPFPH